MAKQPKKKPNTTWATEVLREDHERIGDLFEDFDDPDEKTRRSDIREQALVEIRVHRALVQEVLLPAVREASNDPNALADVEESLEGWEPFLAAVERLHVDDHAFRAAWQALKKEIASHLKEGHDGLLKLANALPLDYVAMGLKMAELRRQIIAELPTSPS